MAVLEDEQELVELGAIDLEFFAANFVADVALLAIVADFERFERDFLRVDFVVAAGFGQARIFGPYFSMQRFDAADDVFREVLQVLAGLGEIGFDLFDLFAMFVDVEQRNAADADLQQAIDICIDQLANKFFRERFEAVVNGRDDRFVRFALLDFFVDAFLDENAFERAEMQFVLELAFLELQLALVELRRACAVFSRRTSRHGQFDRAIVFDDDDAAGDRDFAIGECVERVDQLFGADAAAAS